MREGRISSKECSHTTRRNKSRDVTPVLCNLVRRFEEQVTDIDERYYQETIGSMLLEISIRTRPNSKVVAL